ncbi:hypothetical protein ACR6C2_35100 [Streptomyces sp. INA 01156]
MAANSLDRAKQAVRTQVWDALTAAGAVHDPSVHGRIPTSRAPNKPRPDSQHSRPGSARASSNPYRTRPNSQSGQRPWRRATLSTWRYRSWPPPSPSPSSTRPTSPSHPPEPQPGRTAATIAHRRGQRPPTAGPDRRASGVPGTVTAGGGRAVRAW